uniref:Uncharacterized protein n=1 Tax=Leersia perrieri TaxID=77586 RepID=A0A0D9VJL6_9ORYZ
MCSEKAPFPCANWMLLGSHHSPQQQKEHVRLQHGGLLKGENFSAIRPQANQIKVSSASHYGVRPCDTSQNGPRFGAQERRAGNRFCVLLLGEI